MHLTSIQMPIFTSHLHPSSISPPTSSDHVRPTSILVPSHPHTGRDMNITSIHIPSHLHQGPKRYISLPSRSRFTSTHVQTFASHPNPGNESTLLFMRIASQLSGPLTKTCRSKNVRLPSIQYLPRLHLGPQILATFLIYVLYHLHPGHWIRISPPSMSRPTSNQVQNLVSHLIPGRMSPPSRSRELHISSILVLFQPFNVSTYAA